MHFLPRNLTCSYSIFSTRQSHTTTHTHTHSTTPHYTTPHHATLHYTKTTPHTHTHTAPHQHHITPKRHHATPHHTTPHCTKTILRYTTPHQNHSTLRHTTDHHGAREQGMVRGSRARCEGAGHGGGATHTYQMFDVDRSFVLNAYTLDTSHTAGAHPMNLDTHSRV